MTMLPVADILLIERKRCRCGAIHETTSPFRYRLFKAALGEPDKTEIRKLKDFPEKESEKDDLIPLPSRSIAYSESLSPWCAQCFTPNLSIEAARAIRPPAPHQHAFFGGTPSSPLYPGKEPRKPARPVLSLDEL